MAVWDAAFNLTPAGSASPSEGDDRIREVKTTVGDRIIKEHHLDYTEAGAQPRQGLHKEGSGLCFYQASAPTTRNSVALTTVDKGLLWNDSDNRDLLVYSGTAWESIFGGVAGLRSTDMAAGDADSITYSGTYYFSSGGSHLPAAAATLLSHYQGSTSATAFQIACNISTGEVYRRKKNTTWSTWLLLKLGVPRTIVKLTTGSGWTCPADVTQIKLTCCGGGGGGGGGSGGGTGGVEEGEDGESGQPTVFDGVSYDGGGGGNGSGTGGTAAGGNAGCYGHNGTSEFGGNGGGAGGRGGSGDNDDGDTGDYGGGGGGGGAYSSLQGGGGGGGTCISDAISVIKTVIPGTVYIYDLGNGGAGGDGGHGDTRDGGDGGNGGKGIVIIEY